MPHYTFRCEECGLVFERYFSFQESYDGLRCPQGHERVLRLYRPPAIVFKGSGFYVTDHRQNGGGGNGKSADSSSTQTATASKDKEKKPQAAQAKS